MLTCWTISCALRGIGLPQIFSTVKNRSCPPSAIGIGKRLTMQRLMLINPIKKRTLLKPTLSNMRLVAFAIPIGPARCFGETSPPISCCSVLPTVVKVSHVASTPFPSDAKKIIFWQWWCLRRELYATESRLPRQSKGWCVWV